MRSPARSAIRSSWIAVGKGLRMLGAVGMWQPGACPAIVLWRQQPPLGAGNGPPARSIFRQIAHFHAPGSRPGLRTTAIASTGGNAAQGLRRVCQHREGSCQEGHGCGDAGQADDPASASGLRGKAHKVILKEDNQKTDSSKRLEKMLPGSWNWFRDEGGGNANRDEFPIQIWGRAIVDLKAGFGALACTGVSPKVFNYNSLSIWTAPAVIGAVHAIATGVGAFQMTRCQER
jgi:hypothetical protein